VRRCRLYEGVQELVVAEFVRIRGELETHRSLTTSATPSNRCVLQAEFPDTLDYIGSEWSGESGVLSALGSQVASDGAACQNGRQINQKGMFEECQQQPVSLRCIK